MRSQIGHVEGRSEGKDLVFGSDAFFSRILAGATSGFFSAMASVGVGSRTLTARINPLAWMVLNFEDISRERLEILPAHALAFAMVCACWMMTWMTTSLLYLLASQLRWTHLMAIMARIVYLVSKLWPDNGWWMRIYGPGCRPVESVYPVYAFPD